MKGTLWQKCRLSLPGFEPGTFGLEVQRAIHCATGTTSMRGAGSMEFETGVRFITLAPISLASCQEKMTFYHTFAG